MKVPFADLHLQYLSIKDEIDAAIAAVIKSSAFIRGPFVQKFEDEFAAAGWRRTIAFPAQMERICFTSPCMRWA